MGFWAAIKMSIRHCRLRSILMLIENYLEAGVSLAIGRRMRTNFVLLLRRATLFESLHVDFFHNELVLILYLRRHSSPLQHADRTTKKEPRYPLEYTVRW
ncbi:hypothetical protein N7G274_003653 [Stereocaulon virgatum]|uniref:Secreted protein n=1 Tax=Stereocaulon virgatum TaxID=373712 RepID=A0ABR4ABW9_9LECA